MSNIDNMNEMDNWIDGQLAHENFVQRATASDDLKVRLRSIPVQFGHTTVYVPKRAIWATAAAIALLITVNLLSVSKYRNAEHESNLHSESTSYFSYLESI